MSWTDVADVSFDEFVDCVAATPPRSHDPHWRAQIALMGRRVLRFQTILRMEDMETAPDLVPQALGHDASFGTHFNRTNAAHPRVDRETRARPSEIYASNFKHLGYDPEEGA